jgi:hypothetical protein
MEYKIFGTERWPNDEFRAELRAFCDLDDIQREALAAWFESTADFNTYGPELPPGILASPLLPEQFRKTASPIRFLLETWHRRSLQLADIERDLLLLGFDSTQIAKLSGFLGRLSGVKERVWLDALEGTAQMVGLPTIDGINIAWDARPFFGGSSYYYFNSDADTATYRQCLGLTCMAILELMVSDSNGTKQRIAVQMNEEIFETFFRAVNRADEQRASLKAFIKPLTPAPAEP